MTIATSHGGWLHSTQAAAPAPVRARGLKGIHPEVAPDQVCAAISRHLIESSPGLKLLNRGNAATVQQFQAGRKIDKLARNGDTNSVRQAPEVVVRAP